MTSTCCGTGSQASVASSTPNVNPCRLSDVAFSACQTLAQKRSPRANVPWEIVSIEVITLGTYDVFNAGRVNLL